MEEWILCSERLPEEKPSMFNKLQGTNKWRPYMCKTISDKVLVTVEFENGVRMTKVGYMVDGQWSVETITTCKVIAWMKYPEPYIGGLNNDTNRRIS